MLVLLLKKDLTVEEYKIYENQDKILRFSDVVFNIVLIYLGHSIPS